MQKGENNQFAFVVAILAISALLIASLALVSMASVTGNSVLGIGAFIRELFGLEESSLLNEQSQEESQPVFEIISRLPPSRNIKFRSIGDIAPPTLDFKTNIQKSQLETAQLFINRREVFTLPKIYENIFPNSNYPNLFDSGLYLYPNYFLPGQNEIIIKMHMVNGEIIEDTTTFEASFEETPTEIEREEMFNTHNILKTEIQGDHSSSFMMFSNPENPEETQNLEGDVECKYMAEIVSIYLFDGSIDSTHPNSQQNQEDSAETKGNIIRGYFYDAVSKFSIRYLEHNHESLMPGLQISHTAGYDINQLTPLEQVTFKPIMNGDAIVGVEVDLRFLPLLIESGGSIVKNNDKELIMIADKLIATSPGSQPTNYYCGRTDMKRGFLTVSSFTQDVSHIECSNIPENKRFVTLMHEMGHSMGLDHYPIDFEERFGENNLMEFFGDSTEMHLNQVVKSLGSICGTPNEKLTHLGQSGIFGVNANYVIENDEGIPYCGNGLVGRGEECEHGFYTLPEDTTTFGEDTLCVDYDTLIPHHPNNDGYYAKTTCKCTLLGGGGSGDGQGGEDTNWLDPAAPPLKHCRDKKPSPEYGPDPDDPLSPQVQIGWYCPDTYCPTLIVSSVANPDDTEEIEQECIPDMDSLDDNGVPQKCKCAVPPSETETK